MYRPTGFPEPRDAGRLPGTDPGNNDSATRGGPLGNMTFSIGHLILKWKLEIERVDNLGSMSAERQTHPVLHSGLRRVFRPRASDNPPPLRPGLQGAFRQGRTIRSYRKERWISRGSNFATVIFWEALDPIEQEALRSVTSWRTFAAGERLIWEGEQADYMIVILKGRIRICIDENDRDRVLTERGPGQPVGESGGSQVRVRSVSVIAIEPVQGLVVTTEDFNALVTTHPRILDITESRLYNRLTEDQAEYPNRYGPGAVSVMSVGRARPDDGLTVRDIRLRPLSGENCTILFTDVVAFGSVARNDGDHGIIREALSNMTHIMLRGISDVRSEGRGDGLLTVVPPDIPTANVIERLLKELLPALDRYNSIQRDSARFQLRAAVNVGPVTTDTMGVSGKAIIIAARLVEAPIFKKAIVKSTANLGLIASPFVYETAIRDSLNPIHMPGYSRVQVKVKESSMLAWMKLFDTTISPHSDQDRAVA